MHFEELESFRDGTVHLDAVDAHLLEEAVDQLRRGIHHDRPRLGLGRHVLDEGCDRFDWQGAGRGRDLNDEAGRTARRRPRERPPRP